MKKLLLLLFLFLFLRVLSINAQVPSIQWQKSLGGTNRDQGRAMQQTIDGGYILAATTESTNGDVSNLHGTNSDYWIVKVNSTGSIQWQKSLGGTQKEVAFTIKQTTDGGYITAGYSYSNDGDVTGHHGTAYKADYWIVKLDSFGSIKWEKSLGGTENDFARSIVQTSDGGYIVVGECYSNDGDVTGHHGNYGIRDYWIVKLDSFGNIQWQKSLGGTQEDIAYCIQQTTDGGYIVCGGSSSTDGDVTGHHGTNIYYCDYWIVKIDSLGNIQWQKSLGGTDDESAIDIKQTADGGYIIAGSSLSGDGNVTSNYGKADYWIVKIDSVGGILWQKVLGGSDSDHLSSIYQCVDGGYIISGASYSNDGDVSGHHFGFYINADFWIVKINAMGNIQWQKSLGGDSDDFGFTIQQTIDGGYAVIGTSFSTNGDVIGHHSTSTTSDCWMIKFSSSSTEIISYQKDSFFAPYPNPTGGITTINTKEIIADEITITDVLGKTILSQKPQNTSSTIDLTEYNSGIYFVKIISENNMRTFKISKQ